jgi:hypothetical protein
MKYRKDLEILKLNKTLIILITATVALFSCTQNSKSTSEKVKKDLAPVQSSENVTEEESPSIFDSQYIHTRYEYEDSIIIENSLPRGGLRYTDTAGNSFVYTIFWTRLSNQSASPLEFQINFPADSLPLTASSDTYFKLVLPRNKVERTQKALINYDMSNSTTTDLSEKDPIYNYGLTNLESVLDQRLHKPSSFHRITQPKDTVSFYVISLFNKGVKGRVRTGLSLEEQELIYTVNDKKIQVGVIEFQELER